MASFLRLKSENVISETLWTFVYLTDNLIKSGYASMLDDVTNVEIALPMIVKFGIFSSNQKIKYSAFRIISNLSFGDDEVLKVLNF